MSTRATYLFTYPNGYKPDACVYIHHDGYEEGASAYFYEAIKTGGLSAETFIRANDRAELAGSHDSHGDTEYKYTITIRQDGEPSLRVNARKWNEAKEDYEWHMAYGGSLADFCNSHTQYTATGEGKFYDKVVANGSRLMLESEASKQVLDHIQRAVDCLLRGHTGNAGGHISEAKRMVERTGVPVPDVLPKAEALVDEAFAKRRSA